MALFNGRSMTVFLKITLQQDVKAKGDRRKEKQYFAKAVKKLVSFTGGQKEANDLPPQGLPRYIFPLALDGAPGARTIVFLSNTTMWQKLGWWQRTLRCAIKLTTACIIRATPTGGYASTVRHRDCVTSEESLAPLPENEVCGALNRIIRSTMLWIHKISPQYSF
jgi:hypothetical protein